MAVDTHEELVLELLTGQVHVQLDKSCAHVGALCDKLTLMGLGGGEWFEDAENILTQLTTLRAQFNLCFPPE